MATTTALMTVDEFLELPEKEGVRQELSDGVLIEEEITELGRGNSKHERVKANFTRILILFAAQQQLWELFPESLFKLTNSARIPDISLVSKKRLIPGDPDSYRRGAPEIAVEVVSSESAAELATRIRQYLGGGSQYIWVAYPEDREICVWDRDGTARMLLEDQVLECPELLPGFRVPVSEFFEGI